MSRQSVGIILDGNVKRRRKIDIQGTFFLIAFGVIPVALLIGAIVMIIIHLTRLNDNIFVKLIQLIGDFFRTRTGWFFADGATFASVYEVSALEYAVRMIPMAVILLIGTSLLGDSVQCPNCKHYFVMKRISTDKYIDTTQREVSKTTYDYGSATTITPSGNVYYTGVTTKGRKYGIEETDHYTYNRRCSCCGCVVKVKKERKSTTL